MKTKKALKAIGYVRVSRIGGRGGDSFISPPLQRQSIERVCQREGLTLITTVEEFDRSGGDNSRPVWNDAIERVESGEFDRLVTWNLSRFSRSTADGLKAIERLQAAGGDLVSEEGTLGTLTMTILFAVAQDERERAKLSFAYARATAVEKGIHVCTVRRIPIGYTRDEETRRLVLDPEKAPIVREMFEMRVKGISWEKIAQFAGLRGASAARYVCKNRVYLGEARAGEFVNADAHEAIVSALLFERANVQGIKHERTGEKAPRLLLLGLARCGGCGFQLYFCQSRDRLAYQCRNRKCEARGFATADELDAHVEKLVMKYLALIPARAFIKGNELGARVRDAETVLAEHEHALAIWTDNVASLDIIGATAWNAKAKTLADAASRVRSELTALREEDEVASTTLTVASLWGGWSVPERREFLAKMVEKIVVKPAYGVRGMPLEARVTVLLVRTKSRGWLKPFGVDRDHWSASGIRDLHIAQAHRQ